MNLAQLIAEYRSKANDTAQPPACDNIEVLAWLDDAEREAAVRAHLLFDDTTTAIREVAVVTNTAAYAKHALALNVKRAVLEDADGNRLPLVVTNRADMDAMDDDWEGNDAGEPKYLVDEESTLTLVPTPAEDYTLYLSLFRLPLEDMGQTHAVTFQDTGDTVTDVAHGHADGEPVLFVSIDQTTGIDALEIYYIRDAATNTYKLSASSGGVAMPLTTDGAGEVVYLGNSPEIHANHHRLLVEWVLFHAYSKRDEDIYDPSKASVHEARFAAAFGMRPDANVRRKRRGNPTPTTRMVF